MIDYKDLNLTVRLNSEDSLLERQRNSTDSLTDDARIVDTAEITTTRLKDKSVTSVKLADTLALGTVSVDVLTGGTITGTAVFYGERDILRYILTMM